jgi:phosphate transport system substrate-binding protein
VIWSGSRHSGAYPYSTPGQSPLQINMKTDGDNVIRRSGGISRTIFVIGLVVVAVVSGLAGYFAAGYFKPSQASITLTGAGATFPYPFLSAVSINYSRTNPGVQVNYQSIGSGGGIKALIAKTVDFAASDAPLNDQQRANATNSLHIPETIGSVVFAYNIPKPTSGTFPKGLNLTGDIIAGIFLGSITNWNDASIQNLNPGFTLPNHVISVVHRSDGSGTTFVWTSYLSSVSPTWNQTVGAGTSVSWPSLGGNAYGAAGNEGVAGSIRGNSYWAGYVELAYALQNSMSYGFIKNPAGYFIEPTLASTKAALNTLSSLPSGDQSWKTVNLLNSADPAAYPIASFTYLLVYKELNVVNGMTQAKAKALVDFLWFVVHSPGGQDIGPSLGYVPLPGLVTTIDETTIKSITFNGTVLRS